ncbi:MAG: galactokinase [Kangiellaceae bacterium]|nr:galactokinase [Kangiellaceae bacterium]MCW9000309.1 galactokinase [Kangiellaceae bacterium]
MLDRKEKLISDFERVYQSSPQTICNAPGRVNIIGDHTDYNQGFVLPAAINFGTHIAANKRDDNKFVVVAADFDFEEVEFSLDNITRDNRNCWSNYVKGTIQQLLNYFDIDYGANLVVSGNIPRGAGLSSSASFEMAILKTFSLLFGLELDGVKAALMGQAAENDFVGCKCGIMDQLISAKGKKGTALLIDCENLQIENIQIPQDLSLLVINSNVPRGLVDSEYNLRRTECEQVAERFDILSLRQLKLADLQESRNKLDPIHYKRAYHVLTESKRVLDMVKAFQNSDNEKISQLMYDSHDSLKTDFQVSCEQTDYIVEIVKKIVGDKGGARMTGGGFGGCVVCLIPESLIEVVKQEIETQYRRKFSLDAEFYLCSTEDGAFND